MRKSVFFTAISCLLLVCLSASSFSQTIPDSLQLSSVQSAEKLFHQAFGLQSPVYNGKQYYMYSAGIKGNAYFQDNFDFKPGLVFYDGERYPVTLLYDLYGGLVVILLPDRYSTISLLNEKVGYFDYLDHHFVNINADSLSNRPAGFKSGYYDQVYSGRTAVLVRRSKSIQQNAGGIESHFAYRQDLYLKKDGTYYESGSISRVLEIFGDHKRELQQYLRSSHLRFRKNPEDVLVKLASYYDHLAQ